MGLWGRWLVSEETLESLARRFALKNAVDHEGEANQGAVIGRVMAYDDAFKERAGEVAQVAGRIVDEVNTLSAAEQAERLEEVGVLELEAKDERREGLPALPGVEEGQDVVMRFAPNPNGPPSLGHSRGMCINGAYAQEHEARLILRFDDTDAVNKPPWEPAYGMFEEAFEWLGIDVDDVVYASDRLPLYHEHAREALEAGLAYTCQCSPEAFREHKKALEPCPHRGEPVEVQLGRWEAMLAGSFEVGGCVVRVKTDMQHPDPALRDWVAFRLIDAQAHPHARVGSEHEVWPLLDFQSAVDDHVLAVSHVIRGKDLADSERKQRYLYEGFGWSYPEVLHWGRVGVHGFGAFSTSGMRAAIEQGEYAGWDDPRLPTLMALERRGFLPEAIMEFWVGLGLSEKDIEVSAETLEAENRKLLDERADRLFFVQDPVRVEVEDQPGPVEAKPPRHPDDPERGVRELVLDGEAWLPRAVWEGLDTGVVFRLKDGGDVRKVGEDRAAWVSRRLSEEREGPIVEWVTGSSVPCEVLRPDASVHTGRVEAAVVEKAPGDVVQFERYGFARLEEVASGGVFAVFGHR